MSDFEGFDPIILEDVDPTVSFESQVRSDHSGEVALIGTYIFQSEAQLDAFMKTFPGHAAFMKSKPGFISAKLHRGIAGANVLIIYAVWESPAAFHAAFQAEEEKQTGSAEKPTSGTIGRRVLVEVISQD